MRKRRLVAVIFEACATVPAGNDPWRGGDLGHAGSWSLYVEEDPLDRPPNLRTWCGQGVILSFAERRNAEAVGTNRREVGGGLISCQRLRPTVDITKKPATLGGVNSKELGPDDSGGDVCADGLTGRMAGVVGVVCWAWLLFSPAIAEVTAQASVRVSEGSKVRLRHSHQPEVHDG